MSSGSRRNNQTIWDGSPRPRISVKKYKCGACGRTFETSTNHFGTIYIGCERCGLATSECVEAEAALIRMAHQQQESDDDDQEQR